MKKLKLLFAVIFIVATFISCDKRNVELRLESVPEYTGTAILAEPYDGNTSCEELNGDYVFSSGRINFAGGTFNLSDANTGDWPEGIDPVTGWPKGLSVTVSEDGIYVSFIYTSDNYCVGAVIVKGGNESNVYTYDPAVKYDEYLRAPDNPNGLPAGLSNLTFCFVDCKNPQPSGLVIALKTFLADGATVSWAVTNGEGSEINSMHMGYIEYIYNGNNSHKLFDHGLLDNPIGTLEMSDYIDVNDGIHYLELVMNVTAENMSLLCTYLYVGTVDGYNNYLSTWEGVTFADYYNFPFSQCGTTTTRTFKIPFDEITE